MVCNLTLQAIETLLTEQNFKEQKKKKSQQSTEKEKKYNSSERITRNEHEIYIII